MRTTRQRTTRVSPRARVSAMLRATHSKEKTELKGILKWPLIVAAVVVVLRVISERAGAPAVFSSMLSVVALHTIIAPLYFAVQIGLSGAPHPYGMLMKLIGIYVVLTRAMILPIYWLARIFEWPESRFAGLAGPDVTPFVGFIAVPFLTAAFWIVASLIVGGLIGSITLGLMRRSRATSA